MVNDWTVNPEFLYLHHNQQYLVIIEIINLDMQLPMKFMLEGFGENCRTIIKCSLHWVVP